MRLNILMIYSTDAYQYLSQQIATRDLYTRVIYYENGDLYIGVDVNYPCFYPFDITYDASGRGSLPKGSTDR